MIDFSRIARAALPYLPELVAEWLPCGRREGREWVAINPTRDDHRLGSFKINLDTGKWADFATGDCGGDVISLLAYLTNIGQVDAARVLTKTLGIGHGE